MRILLANTSAYPVIGGVENSLYYIGRELLRAGHEVKILCLQTSPDQPLCMEHESIEIIRIPYTPKHWPHTRALDVVKTVQRAIPSVLQTFQPDVVWSRSALVGLGIRRGGYRGSLLHIFCTNTKMNCRGLYFQTHGLPVRRRLMLLALWPFDYLVSSSLEKSLARQCKAAAFSENMRNQLLADFPKDARFCNVISPGVDTEVFSPKNGSQYFEKIERDYGLSRNEPILLYVGRLSNAKNIPMLMDAVCHLKLQVKLVLVGGGPEEARLKSYADKIGLTERLVFAGKHYELLAGFYALSRICVLPTTIESFGQVYLESLASGTPAVGFSGNGRSVLTATDEIIQDGLTGGVVKKTNAIDLAEKISAILSLDNTAYEAMSRRAREDVRKRFSWNRFVNKALAASYEISETSNSCENNS